MRKSRLWTFVGIVAMCTACFIGGMLVADINKLIGKYSAETPTPALARTQVKFLPFPPIKMLKTETVVWIDPGWQVVGATDKHLILSTGERPWEKE